MIFLYVDTKSNWPCMVRNNFVYNKYIILLWIDQLLHEMCIILMSVNKILGF